MARYSVKRLASLLKLAPGMARVVKGLMEGTVSPDNFKDVRAWERQCHHRPRRAERVMCALNQILDGFGVESCRGQHVDNYYFDNVACYVNRGDSYTFTIFQNHVDCKYEVMGWEDWVMKYERRYELV